MLGRWILSRLDALTPAEIAAEFGTAEPERGAPGLSNQRDFDVVALQGVGSDRGTSRKQFRKVAEAIGRRYLKQVEVFDRLQIADIASFLDTSVTPVPNEKLQRWRDEIEAEVTARAIQPPARRALERAVDDAIKSEGTVTSDLRVALLRILVHRRAPVRQLSLFGAEESEPSEFTFDESLVAGAEIHLFRTFDRPYYFGFEKLALASSENPELFVRLSGALVEAALNRVLRRQRPTLSAAEQHRLLREKASALYDEWNFPEASNVRLMLAGIARRCEAATDTPNAYLNAGANAMGIPMAEFNKLRDAKPALATVIKFGVAYSSFSLSLDRTVKNKQWCIITLGGVACLRHGLTLALGGFVEGNADELWSFLQPA